MQRFRDFTFRRKPERNTLEAQAKAEANKIQQQKQQLQQRSSNSPSSTPTHGLHQTSIRSPTNSTFDELWSSEPSPPLSPARNETSLSFSSNPSNEDIEEEDEEDNDEFDMNMSALTLNETYRPYSGEPIIAYHHHHHLPTKKTCLEVPAAAECEAIRQMRSASFDEIRPRDLLSGSSIQHKSGCSSLDVPESNYRNTRSRSFDYANTSTASASSSSSSPVPAAAATSATASSPQCSVKASSRKQQYRENRTDSTASGSSFLDVPKWKLLIRRPSSSSNSSITDSVIKECVHCILLDELNRSISSDMMTDSEMSSYNEEDEQSQCTVVVNTTITVQNENDSGNDNIGDDDEIVKSEVVLNTPQPEAVDEFLIDEFIEPIEGLPIVTLCPPEADTPTGMEVSEDDNGSGITVISLEVPVLSGSKQARSASVDSPYLLQVPKRTDIEVREGPPKARSKSVDIVLPTNPGGPYLIVPPLRQQPVTTK
ncbi:hypothetical protein RDWZM_005513 [Blomia tropicalis]|uniref:Uncharacterized protein n=1 Tax=Blomia tropicalis TaxID=40697 RepID=A0A9Q0RNI5_BLOTA|nr:hypothetical protein RDWZM_005513 [Blomia tropicalis]